MQGISWTSTVVHPPHDILVLSRSYPVDLPPQLSRVAIMDEKRASAPRTSRSPSFLRRHNSRSRRLIPFAMLIALTFLYLTQMFPSRERSKSWLPESRSPINEGTARTINSSKIPLEAHIMSKCPDARDCLRDMVVPTMVEVADLVDFKLSFIGE